MNLLGSLDYIFSVSATQFASVERKADIDNIKMDGYDCVLIKLHSRKLVG